MKGDFSRLTFDVKKHYTRVLKQQGRVDLDADWNEQIAILLHRLETLAADIIGPFGGPKEECGFEITPANHDFKISKGRYYVHGLLCENDKETTYSRQPFLGAETKFKAGATYVIYLDVWEQYVNAIEDPDLLEKALGGVDTAGRSRVVWRVIAREFDSKDVESVKQAIASEPAKQFTCKVLRDHWIDVENFFHHPSRGMLSVRAEQPDPRGSHPGIISPAARFRGTENQLYRVEVHHSGPAASGGSKPPGKGEMHSHAATFKWSRENGSVVFPVSSGSESTVTLSKLGSDPTLGLNIGDWVELVDDASTAHGKSTQLMRVENVKRPELQIALQPGPHSPISLHPYLRRWDQKSGPENKGGLTLREGEAIIFEDRWLDLEDGIQIRFEPAHAGANYYCRGDYWYIPARTVDNGKIDWPQPVAPEGIDHRYAPLAIMNYTSSGFEPSKGNCVMRFDHQGHFGKG